MPAIAIAARDEEAEIGGCLESVAAALDRSPIRGAVALFVNNTVDGTAARARLAGARLGLDLTVVEGVLPAPQAHAGTARQMAARIARQLCGEGGLILLTDADSRVRPDWVVAMQAGLGSADVVCGRVELPPDLSLIHI